MTSIEPLDPIAYHQRSKHRFEGYAKGPDTIDWEAQPDPFRRYSSTPLVNLSLSADSNDVPFADLSSGERPPAQAFNLDSISLLLELSLALSAWKQYGAGRWSLRCNPSSGNLHPTEAYLISQQIPGLENGVYHYRADVHKLEQRCRFPDAMAPESPGLWLALSSVHWREAWKYGERAYRYCQHDVGHALAAVAYGAAVVGWQVQPCFDIGDDLLAQLLGLQRKEDFGVAEREHPDLLVQLIATESPVLPWKPLVLQALEGLWQGMANILDRRHLYQWPVIDAVSAACHKHTQPTSAADTPDPLPPVLPTANPIAASRLLRQRRSAQAFDGTTVMSQQDFFRTLDHLLPRATVTPWDSLPWQPRVHLVLFVHRVEGLKPGLYALPRRSGALALMQAALRPDFPWQQVEEAPAHLPLYQLISANAQRTVAKLSCMQAIAGDSAFSLAMLGEFESTLTNAPWRYRELFWEAGVIGQVLYLEAEASGLRGTGIGCYFDDPVHELLGIQNQALQSLYHFTVGGPKDDNRIMTLPPYSHLQSTNV